MFNSIAPIASKVTILMNGAPVGAVRSFSEKTVRELHLIRNIGSAENRSFHLGPSEHILSLEFLIPTADVPLVDASDLHLLQDFTIHIRVGDKTLFFTGCQYESIKTSCTVGKSIVCEAVVHALGRTVIKEG